MADDAVWPTSDCVSPATKKFHQRWRDIGGAACERAGILAHDQASECVGFSLRRGVWS